MPQQKWHFIASSPSLLTYFAVVVLEEVLQADVRPETVVPPLRRTVAPLTHQRAQRPGVSGGPVKHTSRSNTEPVNQRAGSGPQGLSIYITTTHPYTHSVIWARFQMRRTMN